MRQRPASSGLLVDHYPPRAPLPAAVQLPDGTWIRGRGLRRGDPDGPCPDFGLYLGVDYQPSWPREHLAWPDFWLPRHAVRAAQLLQHVHRLAGRGQRVEIACWGGRGRTGTALAAIATLAGVPAEEAVGWVRRHYHRRAVETPWQRRWVRRFPGLVRGSPGPATVPAVPGRGLASDPGFHAPADGFEARFDGRSQHAYRGAGRP